VKAPTIARWLGVVVALAGAALALYSFPFVTWVAFSFFVLGLVAIGIGVWLLAAATRATR
jgi:hypothetical protein